MTAANLAARTGAINLGQGLPDVDGPPATAEAAIRAIRSGHNRYPPGQGVAELRVATAADAVVVTDEVYEHLTYGDAVPPPAGDPARDGRADADGVLGG